VGGTGLGLAIVKHIINRHRGRLFIESALDQGTQVSVFLPTSTPS
jgi:two-component system phosphate regulon sensor histidine kinase PhoR